MRTRESIRPPKKVLDAHALVPITWLIACDPQVARQVGHDSGRPLKKLRLEFAFRSEPVVEVAAVLAAACEEQLVRTTSDFGMRNDDRGLDATTSAG
jgi:hypothetical protein